MGIAMRVGGVAWRGVTRTTCNQYTLDCIALHCIPLLDGSAASPSNCEIKIVPKVAKERGEGSVEYYSGDVPFQSMHACILIMTRRCLV
mmetsp:Transcript_4395/g.10602  ORF Transcript_4395/g.10602 Transcript_4395/m.10602 type:complete len:89 (-) Transcript_4395:135-401(-)